MSKIKNRENLKILHLTSELTPLAKNGGLGDVAGQLPKSLATDFQVEIRIVMPRYRCINLEEIQAQLIAKDIKLKMPDDKTWKKFSIWKTFVPDTTIPVYLIDCPDVLTGEGDLYIQNTLPDYDSIPFLHLVLIAKVGLEFIKTQDWQPDVIHYHDGYEGMVSKWLKTIYQDDSFYKNIATVVTVHNMAAQPNAELVAAKKLGLKRSDFKETKKYTSPGYINFIVEAIFNSDMINTVSPTYAKEVLTKKRGFGLHLLLRSRKKNFTGILNGMDYENFDPRRNDDTPVKYWIDSLDKKVENKLYLQKKFGLTQSADLPLICTVTRISPQKGLDLIDEIMDEIIDMGAQFIILGGGEKSIESLFVKAEKKYPKSVEAEMQFDANLAQTIYAGADMLLMPSRFEPCGLSQIIAMRFGTIPIVRKTGGLADTVRDGYTGFVFNRYDKTEFLQALRRAMDIYYNKKDDWRKMQINAMEKDFSWKSSAKKYLWLYKKAIHEHKDYLKKQNGDK